MNKIRWTIIKAQYFISTWQHDDSYQCDNVSVSLLPFTALTPPMTTWYYPFHILNICSGAALSPRSHSVWLLVVYQEDAYHCQLHLGLNLMFHTKCGGITHPPYVVLYLRRLLALVPSSYTIYVPFSLSIKMATNDICRMVLLPSPPPEYFRRSFIFAPSLLPSRRKPNTNISFVPVYYYRMSHCAELMHYLSFIRLLSIPLCCIGQLSSYTPAPSIV